MRSEGGEGEAKLFLRLHPGFWTSLTSGFDTSTALYVIPS